jgi:hypothetical protein
MKVEFLAGDPADWPLPLIRLFDYRAGHVERLRQACEDLAEGRRAEFRLHDQPWVEALGGCRFVWRAGAKDAGVRLPAPSDPFVLEFSGEAWREVRDKLLPFLDDSTGYNWLTNEGEVNVLLSPDGGW